MSYAPELSTPQLVDLNTPKQRAARLRVSFVGPNESTSPVRGPADAGIAASFSGDPARANGESTEPAQFGALPFPEDVYYTTPQLRVLNCPEPVRERGFVDTINAMEDPSSQAVLIYPKKIDDLHRFRVLFVSLLLFIVSSTQGLHSLFGVMLMERQYLYTVEQMTNVYLCGAAFGMFVFPFGVLYDWFGPRVVIVLATIITALGHVLFALMFRGNIRHTPTNSALFYAIMSWGCYALDVAVLPALLTHMPRDRGQPTGMLKTFSGLGSSFISCLFRGFFNGHFDHLMWFMLALTVVFGAVGAVYIEDAPYVTTRWQQRHVTPRKQLRNFLIRNRYMSQLMPRRRYYMVAVVLVLLNLFLTIQAVCAAYLQADMTIGKYRGIAIGSIVITLLLTVLVIPVRAIDGIAPQDEEVIREARRREEELRVKQRESAWADSGAGLIATLRHRYEPTAEERPLLEVEMDGAGGNVDGERVFAVHVHTMSSQADTPQLQHSMTQLDVDPCRASTYHNPYVETITVCGEVFVPPVYQTTFLESLTYVDIWLMFYTTLVMWGVGLTMTANWNIEVMVLARVAKMDYKLYILFAAMSGVATAGGRVFLGVYEQMLRLARQRIGASVVETVGYPLPSIGMLIALIFWIALPGDKVLVLAYILGPTFYGASTSFTIYVLGTVFDRDMGMHYGFCFLGAAIGMVFFFRLAWFMTYDANAVMVPLLGKRCIGQRRCMNKAVGSYIAAVFSSIVTSYIVHWRYRRLVQGKLKQRRVFVPAIKSMIMGRQRSSDVIGDGSGRNSGSRSDGRHVAESVGESM